GQIKPWPSPSGRISVSFLDSLLMTTNLRAALAFIAAPLLATCITCAAASDASGVDAGTLAPTGDMSVARFDHAAALLPNGQVLIVGGISRNGEAQPTAELFDP